MTRDPDGTAEPAAGQPSGGPGWGAALLVLAGASLFGTIGTAQALGPDVPSPQLAAARLLLAAVLMVGAAGLTGYATGVRRCVRQAPAWWAGLGQAGFNVCFLAAMKHNGVAVGTLVAIGATPIITGLLSRQVSRAWLGATAVAVSGLTLLVVGQGGAVGSGELSVGGLAWALGASASYATYIIAGNAAAGRGLDTQPFLAVSFSVAALLTLPLLFTGPVAWAVEPAGALLVAYMAVVPTLVAYSLFNRGLHGVRSSTASTLGLIEPVVAAGLAYLLLDERLSALGAFGAVLILVGLLLLVRSHGRTRPEVVVG